MVAMPAVLAHRDEILRIAAKHGARNLRLFGSVVRGQATPQSDLDLLVHLDADRSLVDHVSLKLDLEDLLDCRVDVVDDDALPTSIRERILNEAVSL
jgi:predicted nucleotidyltransferase